MKNLVILNQESLDEKVRKIIEDGAEKLHVVSDFDRTLTKAFVRGVKVPSIISVLRDGNYLTPEYRAKAQEYAKYYGEIERNPNIPIDEKKKAMLEWWTKHFELLIKTGLTRKDIGDVVKSRKVRFRKGAVDFVRSLHKSHIPLIILSSSGLGDALPMYFQDAEVLFDNVHFITNFYEWDKNGKAIGVRKPFIHSMNKDENSIRKYPVFEFVKDRKNVLLLGNSLGDLGMVEGFPYETLLSVGFYNEKPEDSHYEQGLEQFKKRFDVVVLNDSDMSYVNGLLRRIK